MFMVKLRTKNDVNGNPRHVYVLYGEYGEIVNTWDVGYSGYAAVPEQYQTLAQRAPEIPTTYKEYNAMVRRSKRGE